MVFDERGLAMKAWDVMGSAHTATARTDLRIIIIMVVDEHEERWIEMKSRRK